MWKDLVVSEIMTGNLPGRLCNRQFVGDVDVAGKPIPRPQSQAAKPLQLDLKDESVSSPPEVSQLTFSRRLLLFFLFPVLLLQGASAQTSTPPTRLQRALTHFDLGVNGIATFTKSVSGTVSNPAFSSPFPNSQSASTAAGVLVQIRGEKSPYVGLEFNFSLTRYAQTYACCNQSTVSNKVVSGQLVAQATANEYTLGYLVRPPHKLFGTDPYASVGAGTIEFKPTSGGGQGLPVQARATYYYSVGVEAPLFQHVGARAGFRQQFYLAPDFTQNYLQLNKHTFTSEPQIGFFLHF